MKRAKRLQRILALSLACGLVLPPAMPSNVHAEDRLPVTLYATPEQALASFDTDSGTTDKTAKKVIFGKDASGASLEWYIAGQDPVGGGLVLVSAEPYETAQIFNSEGPNRPKDYISDPAILYESGDPAQVYYNHYGTSDIRSVLNGEESLSVHFTQTEQDMLMESTVGTTDTLNSAIYKTVDKVYLPSAGDQEFQDKDRNGPLTFLVGSSTEENASGSLVFSSDYWLPRPQTFYTRSPRPTIAYHVLTARYFGSNHEVGTADLDDPVNTVAVIQIGLDTIDHFEADSSDEAFRIVYKNEIPEEPDPESFGEVIINDAGNAIDIRGITDEVTLYVEKNGNTYSKSISSDISYPLNLLSFGGTFIENLDGASVYIEKDGVKEYARQREPDEYDNVLVTNEEGAVVSVTDNNHVPNDSSQGPAEYAFDDDRSTFYHTEWNPEYTVSEEQPAVVTIEFSKVMKDIHQMAYLQRRDGGKGNFIHFQINYKVNEEDEWTLAQDVTFDGTTNSEMRFAAFDPIDAKFIQLVVTEGSGSHAAASEIDFFRKEDKKYEELDTAIENAKSFIENAENYTEESISEIQSEIEKAEAVRNDPDASSKDIRSAAKSLNSAVDLAEPVNLAELQKAYDEARRIPNDNYTGSTWANLQNSLSAATELLIGSGRTYEKVEAAIQAIEDAVAGLRYNLDLSALRALVNECSDLIKDDYEAAEWPAFTEALEAAQAILTSGEQITQEQVDEVKEELQNAEDSLRAKFDKTELRDLIDHCDEYMFTDRQYTEEAYDNLQEVLDEAKLVEQDADTTQEVIDKAIEDLKAAEEYLLANKIPGDIKYLLRDLLTEMGEFIASDDNEALYTSESWSNLETVYAEAKEYYDSLGLPQNPMRELYKHYTALVEAKEGLEPAKETEEISTAVLEYALTLAETADTEGVLDSAAEVFNNARASAQDILERVQAGDASVTQAMVDESWQNLIKAMQYLSFKQGDKTDLQKVIDLANSLNLSRYLEEGQQAFNDALTAAEAVLADGDAMQDEIDQAWKALLKAMSELRLKPSKDALEDLIASAESLNTEGADEETAAIFRSALARAVSVFEDEQATETEVASAEKELQTAIDQMLASTGGSAQNPSQTGSSDENAAGSVQAGTGNANSGGSQNSGSNGSRTAASGSKAVKTGDSMFPIAGSAAVMAMAAAVIVLGRRKRSIR